MLVFGGTGTGSIADGQARAQEFLDGIGELMPDRFPTSESTSLGRAFYHRGPTREIHVEYFPRVPVVDGGC